MIYLKSLCDQLTHHAIGDDIIFSGAAIDTRKLSPGDLFVACQGEHVDGHDYIDAAEQAGAKALLVNRRVNSRLLQIIVPDTTIALGQIAKRFRQLFSIPVIAITGSCGKTSTKNILAHLLSHHHAVLATQGNYNNHLGAPLTLLGLKPHHQYAVIELGTSSPGEIAALCDIVCPSVSLITNIHGQHLAGLGSIDAIAKEKSAIFSCLTEGKNIAIINQDDPYIRAMLPSISCHVLRYSTTESVDVFIKTHHDQPSDGLHLTVSVHGNSHTFNVPLLGKHILNNFLASIAVCVALNIDMSSLHKAIASLTPVKGRFFPHHLKQGTQIIDDTYNASKASVTSAIDTIEHHQGKKVFVMSNMNELGNKAEQYHQQMGQDFHRSSIEHVLLTGEATLLAHTLQQCPNKAKYFDTKRELTDHLKTLIDADTMVVIKGSRSNTMEEIVNTLLTEDR